MIINCTSIQKVPFSYNVDDKALRTFTKAHFLHLLTEITRKGTRAFTASWLRRTCNVLKSNITTTKSTMRKLTYETISYAKKLFGEFPQVLALRHYVST